MARPTVSADFDKIRNPTEIMTNNTCNNLFFISFFRYVVRVPQKYIFQPYFSRAFVTYLVSSRSGIEFEMFRL